MEQGKHLAGLILALTLLQGSMAQSKQEIPVVKVDDNQEDGSVLLTCDVKDENVKWFKDGKEINNHNKDKKIHNLGSSVKDPQGIYLCQGSKNYSRPLQVHYRMCQNCIEINAASVSGFVFAEIISVFFLAVGVYFIAGQDGVRQSRVKPTYRKMHDEEPTAKPSKHTHESNTPFKPEDVASPLEVPSTPQTSRPCCPMTSSTSPSRTGKMTITATSKESN